MKTPILQTKGKTYDRESEEIVNALEIGFEIASRQNQVKPKIKVMEVA
jgi:hypothetical protein